MISLSRILRFNSKYTSSNLTFNYTRIYKQNHFFRKIVLISCLDLLSAEDFDFILVFPQPTNIIEINIIEKMNFQIFCIFALSMEKPSESYSFTSPFFPKYSVNANIIDVVLCTISFSKKSVLVLAKSTSSLICVPAFSCLRILT